ncbi:MAG: bifunctional DNA-binding transcriptional regulator/O6-methylguanine-DNA methyltransferase Ada [Gemmatimonadota bacterium]
MSRATTYTDNDVERWSAVVARDRARDGAFVYAVRTTGVYCRPSCPSRRALRENVSFFQDVDAAETAGFRACKRCEPRATESTTSRVIARARAYLETHVDETPALGALAKAVGMSASHLQRTFTREVGMSPRQYAAALRADRLKAKLRAGATVSRATFDAGYGASSRAYDAAAEQLGMTPGAYRRGGKGVHIRYMTAASALGRVLVAASERGVCAVTLGDDDATLEGALRAEYPHATVARVRGARGDDDLRAWVAAVTAYLGGTEREIAVPLDIAGTPFQHRVWRALQEIPYGETRSYSQVAESIAAPTSARAVASACARNRVSLVIPCHRVVRGTGALGGYRWGLARKERLLAREHGIAARRVDAPARDETRARR